MKALLKFMIGAIAATVLVASCSKVEDQPVLEGKTITAYSDVDTKTALSDKSIKWLSTDAVRAYGYLGSYESTKTEILESGSVAKFTFSADGDELVYAAYPAANAAEEIGSNDWINITIPTEQNAVEGGFMDGANAAIAKVVDGETAKFRNATALLSVKIMNDGIKSIKLSATSEYGEGLTGSGSAKFTSDENDTEVNTSCDCSEGGVDYVQVNGDFKNGSTYYFVVFPLEYTSLTITFTDADDRTATFTNSTASEFARNSNKKVFDAVIPDSKWTGGASGGSDDITSVTLSNAEIIAALSAQTSTSDTYADMTIESKSGIWSANCNTKKTLTYLQIRNSRKSCLTSPVFTKDVTYVVAHVPSNVAAGRRLFAIPETYELTDSKDTPYTVSEFASVQYGESNVSTGNVDEELVIVFGENVKQFMLVPYGGAVYINSVDVHFDEFNSISVTGVSLSSETLSLEVDETATLTASVVPANATNKTVTWSTDNEAVATVNNGVVSAISAGTANITATTKDGNFTASCTVTVSAKPVSSVDVITLSSTGVSGTTYKDWTYTGETGAEYFGNTAGGNSAIQFRTTSNSSGIVVKKSVGGVKNVTITWDDNTVDGRSVKIYGKNEAYTSYSELYNITTAGTLLTTIEKSADPVKYVVDGNYAYIGIRSADAALYLSSISIEWGELGTVVEKTAQTLSFSQTSCTATVGTAFTPPTLTGAQTAVTYSSSNKSAATVDSSTGAITIVGVGTTTITATAAESDTYKPAEASYTITVSASGNDPVEETISGTFSMSNGELVLTTSSGITIKQKKGESSTAVGSSYDTPSTLRVYKGHILEFSSATKTITKVEIVVKNSYFGDTLEASEGTLTNPKSSGCTITWEGESSDFTITSKISSSTTTQLRPYSIVVTYK